MKMRFLLFNVLGFGILLTFAGCNGCNSGKSKQSNDKQSQDEQKVTVYFNQGFFQAGSYPEWIVDLFKPFFSDEKRIIFSPDLVAPKPLLTEGEVHYPLGGRINDRKKSSLRMADQSNKKVIERNYHKFFEDSLVCDLLIDGEMDTIPVDYSVFLNDRMNKRITGKRKFIVFALSTVSEEEYTYRNNRVYLKDELEQLRNAMCDSALVVKGRELILVVNPGKPVPLSPLAVKKRFADTTAEIQPQNDSVTFVIRINGTTDYIVDGRKITINRDTILHDGKYTFQIVVRGGNTMAPVTGPISPPVTSPKAPVVKRPSKSSRLRRVRQSDGKQTVQANRGNIIEKK